MKKITLFLCALSSSALIMSMQLRSGKVLALPSSQRMNVIKNAHPNSAITEEGAQSCCDCLIVQGGEFLKAMSALWLGAGISWYTTDLQQGFDNSTEHLKTVGCCFGIPACGILTALQLQKYGHSNKKD